MTGTGTGMNRRGAFVMEGILAAAALLSLFGALRPLYLRYRDNANRLKCLDNLRRIGEGIAEWSKQHDYALPPGKGMSGYCNSGDGTPLPGNRYAIEPGLNALWDKGNGVIRDVEVFRCPADGNLEPPPAPGEDFTSPGQLSYSMTGDIHPTDAYNKVVVADKSDKSRGPYVPGVNHDRRFINVLFFDGRVRTVQGPVLPIGVASDAGSIYLRESGTPDDTYME
ncbi:MAG: hypothetical protein LBT97_13125 [Planctomycetota bacterium]|nr:hypothetical protein [Planctomycetota bacterium]